MTTTFTRGGFNGDLELGHECEEEIRRILVDPRLEVKDDRKARETGNVFVEYHQPSGPSGIATSNAPWWAIKYGEGRILIVERGVLRKLAIRAFRAGKVVRGGDFNNYTGVLVPLHWFMERDGSS